MKKTFTLAAIGLMAAIFLSAGALLIGRYDQPKDDDSAVERLSVPVSQIGSGSAQQAPNVQRKEQSPAVEPPDPPAEAPQTSLDRNIHDHLLATAEWTHRRPWWGRYTLRGPKL